MEKATHNDFMKQLMDEDIGSFDRSRTRNEKKKFRSVAGKSNDSDVPDLSASSSIPDLASLNRFKFTGKAPLTAMFEDQELEDTTPYLIHTLYYTDNEQCVNDPSSEVTRGRDNWLVDGFSDADAYAKATPYRRPVLINNLFDDTNDGDEGVQSNDSDPKETKNKKIPLELLEESSEEGVADQISGPKLYLLKLVEFNKIAILEKFGFGVKQSASLALVN